MQSCYEVFATLDWKRSEFDFHRFSLCANFYAICHQRRFSDVDFLVHFLFSVNEPIVSELTVQEFFFKKNCNCLTLSITN